MKWFDDAACKSADPELFSPSGTKTERQRKTRAVVREFCDPCPVREACLHDALRVERRQPSDAEGIRGGLDAHARTLILVTERTAS